MLFMWLRVVRILVRLVEACSLIFLGLSPV
jgi:hypothetical protein